MSAAAHQSVSQNQWQSLEGELRVDSWTREGRTDGQTDGRTDGQEKQEHPTLDTGRVVPSALSLGVNFQNRKT